MLRDRLNPRFYKFKTTLNYKNYVSLQQEKLFATKVQISLQMDTIEAKKSCYKIIVSINLGF